MSGPLQRRFNVATSRSKSTTLIITDIPLRDFHTVPSTVIRFVSMCDKIDKNYSVQKNSNNLFEQVVSGKDESQPVETLGSGAIQLKLKGKVDLSKFERPKKELVANKKNLYIIDTNVTEQKKKNAEKALWNLNNEKNHEIIYEFADTSLLPEDFDKRSPDNMILSVALKYKKENPIMLPSDNGLQLKSKILGITTISLKKLLRKY